MDSDRIAERFIHAAQGCIRKNLFPVLWKTRVLGLPDYVASLLLLFFEKAQKCSPCRGTPTVEIPVSPE